jgi:hypothetical protein
METLEMTDFIREFPVVFKTDRDCEIPLLTEFISRHGPLGSLLDIGAHWSGHHYVRPLRGMVRQWDGIDIQPCDDVTRHLLSDYYVGNANTEPFEPKSYDAVICVSTIEHSGVSTYQGDYVLERNRLFSRCLSLAKKYVWISFPVGQECVCPGQMAIITEKDLRSFEEKSKAYKVQKRFIYSQGPQAGHPWREHEKREVALSVPYMGFIGNQSICVMEIEK